MYRRVPCFGRNNNAHLSGLEPLGNWARRTGKSVKNVAIIGNSIALAYPWSIRKGFNFSLGKWKGCYLVKISILKDRVWASWRSLPPPYKTLLSPPPGPRDQSLYLPKALTKNADENAVRQFNILYIFWLSPFFSVVNRSPSRIRKKR